MEDLKLAIAKRDTETVKKLFASKLASVGLFNIISEQQGLINKASDALSQILIPDDLVENNQHFVAVKTTGNGNCLYNATSLSISGNESLASELRYLCAAELYMNSASYANYQAFSSDDDFGMCLSGSAEKVFTLTKDREAAIRNEAEETCNITPRPKWSNLIHIAALSNVIKRPVCSIYPDNTGFPYRKLFNRQFKPNDELVSDIPIYILWSVDGGLPHGPFNPNHFVCVTRRTVCTSETTASLDKTTASLEKTTASVDKTTASLDKTTASLDKTTASVDKTTASVDKTTASLDKTTASLDKTTASLDKTRKRKGRTLIDYFSSKQTKPTNHEDHSLSVDMGNSVGQQEADFPAEKKIVVNGNPQSNTEPGISPTDDNVTDTAMNTESTTQYPDTIPRNEDIDEHQKPNQPKIFNFPKRPFGKKTIEYRSFKPVWFEKFQWIHYNENEDKAYCHPCQIASRKRLIKSSKASQAFISTGFSNWNDAHRCFGKHEQSECHLEALQKLNVDKSSTDIGLAMVKQIGDVRENNRSCLMTILSNLQFLSRQGLPFRGSSDDSDSNFVQLNLLRCEDNQNFREWLTRKSDKYTSPDIQNEILKIMAQMIVREISDNIRKSLYFALMADETTDVANKEQLVVCLRWIDQALDVHEDFIGLYQIDNTSAQTITDSIQDALVRLNISLSQCRGQTYDGASAMSGPKSGVQKRIKDEQPKALYNHCHGHRLNLACPDNIKKTKIMCDALDTTYEITKLVKKSPHRDTQLDKIRKVELLESDDGNYSGIRVLCPTRWTVKADALLSIINNHESLMKLWEWSLERVHDTDMKARIRGVQSHMLRFDFFFGLTLGECLLRNADNLSAGLQSKDLSAAEGKSMAMKTVKAISLMRSDEAYGLFWQKVIQNAERKGVAEPCLPRQKRMPARFETGNAAPEYHDTTQAYFRQIYYEAIDHLVNAIEDRFDTPDFAIYANAEQLLIKCVRGEVFEEEFETVTTFYGDDFHKDNLRTQLQMLSVNFECDGNKGEAVFSDITNFFKGLSKGEKIWLGEVVKVLQLVLVMPATNATSERSFSSLRRMKTYLRSTMTQSRLNNLMVLNVHKEKNRPPQFGSCCKRICFQGKPKEHFWTILINLVLSFIMNKDV